MSKEQEMSSTQDTKNEGTKPTHNPNSYVSIIQDMNRFRASALNTSSAMFDFPGQVFFRVLFHFYNNSDAGIPQPSATDANFTTTASDAMTGLIGPSWLRFGNDANVSSIMEMMNSGGQSDKYEILESLWSDNTAFNYLMVNDEQERARNVISFVELLSNINSISPWYFQNIKGLDEALNRAMVTSGEFMFKPEPSQITIECLDDSYDQRIGTLLDLYRSIVWSWETKRMVLPRNLRKFDMTVIAFQLPVKGLHISRSKPTMTTSDKRVDTKNLNGLSSLAIGTNEFTLIYNDGTSKMPVASYKAFEFHGCEIDYNSSISGWGEISNAEGSIPKYSIKIFYDDCFEIRFNEFLGSSITDLMNDFELIAIDSNAQTVHAGDDEIPEIKTAEYKKPSDILGQVIGTGMSIVETQVKKVYLGNIHGLSLSRVRSQIGQALSGDLFGTINNVANYARGNWGGGNAQLGENIFPDPGNSHFMNLGNLYAANTVIHS